MRRREIEPHPILIKFIYLFYVVVVVLFTYILAFFLGYFLIKHEILFLNVARAESECIFSFVSLLFISLL